MEQRGGIMSRSNLPDQKGQSIILVAVAMVALVLFVAITVDMSDAYYHRRTAQNGADGAALGGVRQLAQQINNKKKQDKLIQIEMNDFAERNGIQDTDGTTANEVNQNVDGWYVDMQGNRLDGEPMVGDGTVPAGTYGVEAITYITAPTFFGGVFGLGGVPLQARAVSLVRQACSHDCVVPIAMNYDDLCIGHIKDGVCKANPNRCVNIWDGTGSAYYGWLNWTWQELTCDAFERPCPAPQGTNACDPNTLADNMDPSNCASGFIAVGDWVSGATGVMNAGAGSSEQQMRVLDWLDYYLGLDPSDPVSHTFSIIVWDYTSEISGTTSLCNAMDPGGGVPIGQNWDSAGLHYHVRGFGVMQIMGYQLSNASGESVVNVGHDGTGCEDLGVFPEKGGFRITASFEDFVTEWDSSDACYDPLGTLLSAPRLHE
jgi:Flp pilus assembly protein TadG